MVSLWVDSRPAFPEGRSMRLFSLAVVAGLFAAGFGFAADEKKAEVKKAEKKAGKVTGVLSKIDGMKLTVTSKGDGGEKMTEFTVTEKTKFLQQEAAPAAKDGEKPVEKKAEDKKAEGEKKPAEGEKKPAEKKPAPKTTEIKLADLKTGSRVAVTAGEDKVATEVVVLPAAPKKEGK
jgi:hypothetical protein